MKSLFLSVFLLGLLLLTGKTHSEGNCPEGYYPIGGSSAQGCAPVPGYSQQQGQHQGQQKTPSLPQKWESKWGAIATDGPGGHLGTSENALTQDIAQQTALNDCRTKGGSNCKLENTYANACAAMTVGHNGHNSGSAATLNEAIQNGLRHCDKYGDTNCVTYYSGCSLPVRIQ